NCLNLFIQAEDVIRDRNVTGVQTCALPISVSLGTTMLEVPEIVQDPNFDALMIPYLIAFIAAFIATYFALKALINIMAKGNLAYFSYYCVVVGVLVILFL